MKWTKESRLATVAQHPLAVGLSVWSMFIGVLTTLDFAPSQAIASLPRWQALTWALLAIVAAVSTAWGLFISRRLMAVSRGLYLHAFSVAIYALAIIYQVGWSKGGAAASFLGLMAVVVGLEARHLKVRYEALMHKRGG